MPQLSIEIVYQDPHLLQIMVKASNGRYSGSTLLYLDADGHQLLDFGRRMQGFPKSSDQTEELEFGAARRSQEAFTKMQESNPRIGRETAFVALRFCCIDRLGHSGVGVEMHEDSWSQRAQAIGDVRFELRFEPAQLDKFTKELIDLGTKKEGIAILDGIMDGKDAIA